MCANCASSFNKRRRNKQTKGRRKGNSVHKLCLVLSCPPLHVQGVGLQEKRAGKFLPCRLPRGGCMGCHADCPNFCGRGVVTVRRLPRLQDREVAVRRLCCCCVSVASLLHHMSKEQWGQVHCTRKQCIFFCSLKIMEPKRSHRHLTAARRSPRDPGVGEIGA